MPKPFLKWVGGKTRLLPEIAARLPSDYYDRRHVEPFLGGGAVFFGLRRPGQAARISDVNRHLMATYEALSRFPGLLYTSLKWLSENHDQKQYYTVRKQLNEGTDSLVWEAAWAIYLNKTCFNGLWRTNRDGHFNVPIGDSKRPAIYDRLTLDQCAAHLDGAVEIQCQSYQHAFEAATSDDFLYLDPPYAKLDDTSFTGYAADGFGPGDQTTLRDWCLGSRARIMLSNSDVPYIRALYRDFRIEAVQAPRSVGGSRAKANELLIMNY